MRARPYTHVFCSHFARCRLPYTSTLHFARCQSCAPGPYISTSQCLRTYLTSPQPIINLYHSCLNYGDVAGYFLPINSEHLWSVAPGDTCMYIRKKAISKRVLYCYNESPKMKKPSNIRDCYLIFKNLTLHPVTK